MNEVLVFTAHLTSRLQYTLHWILQQRLGLNFTTTDKRTEFDGFEGCKINYGSEVFGNCLSIEATSILFETGINENFGEIGTWEGTSIIFKTGNGEVPFDIFGAVFYCLSRMEEYGTNTVDAHNRYLHTSSVLHKLDVLETPVVDLWVELFKRKLLGRYPQLQLSREQFKFINTFDIDQAFCYAGKGFKRNLGGVLRDLFGWRLKDVMRRLQVLWGFAKDPYDTFGDMLRMHEENKLESIVFLLMADYGTYDKAISSLDSRFKARIKELQEKFTLGIHPSYYSSGDLELTRKEIKRLVAFQFMPVSQSRQHYLKFTLPTTFRNLLEAGIRHEFSLGYADAPGFRAGTSHPFLWFDVERNEVTPLTLHPCSVMDVTLKNYLRLTPEQAIVKINTMVRAVEQVNGTFIPIWHNESVSDYGEWKGWKEVYEQMIRKTTMLS
jgi:hypothetical protein